MLPNTDHTYHGATQCIGNAGVRARQDKLTIVIGQRSYLHMRLTTFDLAPLANVHDGWLLGNNNTLVLVQHVGEKEAVAGQKLLDDAVAGVMQE